MKYTTNLKYANRRAKLKLLQNPIVALSRKWNKASLLAKVGIGAAVVIPKALLLTAGYVAVSGRNKDKKEPKKYMAG